MSSDMTSIRISKQERDELETLKKHKKESHEDVVKRLRMFYTHNTKYDQEFKTFVKDVLTEHHPDRGILHIEDCHAGLQVMCEKADIILITHLELKIWKVLYDEGLEPSKESYTLLNYELFKTINAKIS